MKKLLSLTMGLALAGFSLSSPAENLLEVYQQAKESNPDLRQAAAQRDSAFEQINQSRGSLLPQLGLGSSYTINRGYKDSSGKKRDLADGTLSLTQTLFDMSLWKKLNITEKQAGVQDVAYQTTDQQLILNTATAYFKVLAAIDSLIFTEANKQAVYQQLDQVTQQFNVGLTAITDVQNARAQYDLVLANEVTARNNLNNATEDLRKISGVYYNQLGSLDVKRFKTSKPGKIEPLLKEAEQRNLSLLTARLSQDVAREQIKLSETGHYPTLDLKAGTSLSKTNNKGTFDSTPSVENNPTDGQTTVGVQFNLPIYSGGITSSQVKQAQYQFVASSEGLESAHRSVVNNLRSSYNNTVAAISSISAYEQAEVSAQSSLDATEAGYHVGTRTIVDVLTATTNLYNAKQQLSSARYNYLISLLNIKSATGTLNAEDLVQLNADLGAPVSTQPDIVAPARP
ncbi:MAG: outer membrane channel protein TolC [Enterobacteriaceae bacterium]